MSDDYVVATQEEFEQAQKVGADLIMSEEAQEKYDAASAMRYSLRLLICQNSPRRRKA